MSRVSYAADQLRRAEEMIDEAQTALISEQEEGGTVSDEVIRELEELYRRVAITGAALRRREDG